MPHGDEMRKLVLAAILVFAVSGFAQQTSTDTAKTQKAKDTVDRIRQNDPPKVSTGTVVTPEKKTPVKISKPLDSIVVPPPAKEEKKK
jgi:hypothetical protein